MKQNIPIQFEVGVKAFIYQDGKYLFLQRSHTYPAEMKLRWDVPGGRIIPGEPFESGLKREIQEETGLQLNKIIKILTVQDILRVPTKHTVRITFLVECKKGKIKINPDEHNEFRWMTLKEIQKEIYDLYLEPVLKLLSKQP